MMEKSGNKYSGPRKHKKLYIILLILVIVGAGAVFGVMKLKGGKEVVRATDLVIKETIEQRVKVNGIIAALSEQRVYAQTSGIVEEILVKAGDQVTAGQVLARLASQDLDRSIAASRVRQEMARTRLALSQENLETARKNLLVAESKYRFAEQNFQSQKALYEQGAISQFEWNNAKVEWEQLQNQYAQEKRAAEDGRLVQEVKLQQDQLNLEEIEYQGLLQEKEKQSIKSPIKGTVAEIALKTGARLLMDREAFYIVDNNLVEIKAEVGEYEARYVKIGDPVRITMIGNADQVFHSTVSFISPYAKKIDSGQISKTIVEVKALLETDGQVLKPGLTVVTDILCARKEDVLTVPYEAILTDREGRQYVFVQKEGQKAAPSAVTPYIVKTGIEGALRVEIITSEVQEGDAVLLNPDDKLLKEATAGD